MITAFLVAFAIGGASFAQDGEVCVTISPGSYELTETDGFNELSIPDYGMDCVPGAPNLPSRIHAIAVPPGAKVTGVTLEPDTAIELPGEYRIRPVQLPRVISGEKPEIFAKDQALYDATFEAVYGSDEAYPAQMGEVVRTGSYRMYNLADVRVTPFSYKPESGKLLYYPRIAVRVHYTIPKAPGPEQTYRVDRLERTEAVARDLLSNFDQAQQWYTAPAPSKGKGLYSMVIITTSSLVSTVQDLADWEAKKDRTVNVVTTSWIYSNYSGYDNAERIRNFLRDKYPQAEWGIEDVLIVGNYNDVPIRRTDQDEGYGRPRTDFYYAELSLPDDESWDLNGDHKWGGAADQMDFYAEVNVGRIPWTTTSTVQDICDKSIAFEMNTDPSFKKNILLLGAYFWPNTDNAVLMEYKSDSANNPWMAGWTKTKMYETGHSAYPADYSLSWTNVKNVWSGGKFGFVNWGGHGSAYGCYRYYSSGAFSDTSTCNYLNDNYPSIVFAAACSNSDTDYTNLGQCMLRQGAVGFLGATKVAYGNMGWNHPSDGSCQAMDYYFTTYVTCGEYSQGEAHQKAMRDMVQKGLWYKGKYEVFEWGALWGNPHLTMGELPEIYLKFPEGTPEGNYPPGPETVIPIVVRDGLSEYVPGSGQFYYRFDSSSSYTSVPFTQISGEEYEVVLPNTTPGDEPEFYFTVQSTSGGTVYFPSNAPSEVCSFDVFLEHVTWIDDFETDEGWTVENVDLDHGAWERGDPEFTFIQPEDDHSEDGTMCFVTGRSAEGSLWDSDVDGGPTRLISPALDLTGDEVSLRFYVWYYQSVFGEDQPLEIHLSNDNGANWTLVDTLDYYNTCQWYSFAYTVSDYVTPTSEVRIRFTACDNPDDGIVEALVDDFKVVRIVRDATLWSDDYDVSVAAGAEVDFSLDAGAGKASRPFLLLGTLSGTLPGFTLPGGMVLPLNWDSFTDLIMAFVGSPVCSNFMGTLDGSGKATATLNTYGPLDPALIGSVADFAYLLGSPFDFVSNPVPVTFEP